MKNCYGYDRQFNSKYTNVYYKDIWWRLYDENTTNSLDALNSECQIKLIELIEKYNFKVFYFKCEPTTKFELNLTKNQLNTINNQINLNDFDTQQLKKLQVNDLYYFYKNNFCEVFYSFAKIDENKNYYFDFMIVVNNNFDLNAVYNYNFNLIKITSVQELTVNNITFDFIQNIFEQRTLIDDCSPSIKDNHYTFSISNYNTKDFIDKYYNGDEDNWEHDHLLNKKGMYLYKQFNQNLYVLSNFRMLCSHIWSMDRQYYFEKNKFGLRIMYNEKYQINSVFLTNFAELVGCISVTINKENLINSDSVISNDIEYVNYTYCSLSDNFEDQYIHQMDFSLLSKKTGYVNFNNLKIEKK